jgi:2-polyprenyl-3-methyl-5-hydroxy-6-metoxy-1,4-benzoquinol methylase
MSTHFRSEDAVPPFPVVDKPVRTNNCFPLWQPISLPRRPADFDIADFFESGRSEVRLVFAHLLKLGVPPNPTGRFLDFGCGMGRISRVLMDYFAEGHGIDSSRALIDQAKTYGANDARQANYIVNCRGDLSICASDHFDFVYSHMVLQHLSAPLQPVFIQEFVRILKPGGVAVFQVPTATVESAGQRRLRALGRALRRPLATLERAVRVFRKDGPVPAAAADLSLCPEMAIRSIIERNNCVLLDARYTNSTASNHRGRIHFMSREQALAEIAAGKTDSPYLSQFFFVLK